MAETRADSGTPRSAVELPIDAVDLCEAAPDGLLVADADGRIRLVNRALESLFGWSRAELLGEPVERLMPPEAARGHVDARHSYARDPRRRPMGIGLTLVGLRRDGSTFPIEISLSPLPAASGAWTMAAVRDVSERQMASEALETARADLARSEERERIARDLHDTVIQHLFAVGMQLQSAVGRAEDPALATKLLWAVDHLDQTVREVRSAIFDLSSSAPGDGMRSQVKAVATQAARTLGFQPRVIFDGLVDTSVSNELADQVLSILRESLSNVVRHAHATSVEVRLVVTDGQLELSVADNGSGIPEGCVEGSGFANLRTRAQLLGGTIEWVDLVPTGTRVDLAAPLNRDANGSQPSP